MKRSDSIVFAIFDGIYLVTACLLARLVTNLILKMTEFFWPVSYHDGAVVGVVITVLVSVALVGILTFRDGYHYASFEVWGALIAAVAHLVLGLISRFVPLLCGPTRDLSGLISQGGFYNSAQKIERIPYGTLALVGIIMMLVYAAVMISAGYAGCRKRMRDRELTLGEETASK